MLIDFVLGVESEEFLVFICNVLSTFHFCQESSPTSKDWLSVLETSLDSFCSKPTTSFEHV